MNYQQFIALYINGALLMKLISLTGNCNNRYTCGLTSGRCYSSSERCDGIAQCISSVDELHCCKYLMCF